LGVDPRATGSQGFGRGGLVVSGDFGAAAEAEAGLPVVDVEELESGALLEDDGGGGDSVLQVAIGVADPEVLAGAGCALEQ
jgi:hypothetical protein